jgi:L-asparagine oxygenase
MNPLLTQPATLCRLVIPEENRRCWQAESVRLTYPVPQPPQDWTAFTAHAVKTADRHIPAEIAAAIGDFFRGIGPDAILLENLPVDPTLPATPSDGKRPAGKTAVTEAVMAGVIESHAAIVSYTSEKAGAPIHEVAPVVGLEEVISSAGRTTFAYHTDAAFLAPRFCPRGLMLMGLRNQPNAPTAILSLDRMMEAADAKLLRSLARPIFLHPAPASFELKEATLGPILWKDSAGVSRIAVQTHAVLPAPGAGEAEARAALANLQNLIASLEPERVALSPGNAVLFRNDRVLHGRDAFLGERWLQRAYFTDSLAPFQAQTNTPAGTFAFDAAVLLQKSVAPSEPIGHSKN